MSRWDTLVLMMVSFSVDGSVPLQRVIFAMDAGVGGFHSCGRIMGVLKVIRVSFTRLRELLKVVALRLGLEFRRGVVLFKAMMVMMVVVVIPGWQKIRAFWIRIRLRKLVLWRLGLDVAFLMKVDRMHRGILGI